MIRTMSTFLAACLAAAACSAAPAPVAPVTPDPAITGTQAAEELLLRDEFAMYEVGDVIAIHYGEVAAAYGAARIADRTGNEALLDGIIARYERVADENVPNTANHVDANVFGALPLELYLHTGDEAQLADGLAYADGQWQETRPDGLTSQTRFWIDDVWMIGILQVQAYRATGEQVYIDRAIRESAAYIERLQQPNGLFHHGPDAPFYWGRGNGWVAAGLAEVIAEMPADHPQADVVLAGYRRMMAALLDYQAEDGMWRQLIDYPDAWKETSGTAMFGFAMAVGINEGLLDREVYGEAALGAWQALDGYIDEQGRLASVCVGTGQSTDPQYYLDRPTVTGDLHGQAPLMWFAAELLRDGVLTRPGGH